uniref:Uncharacterized protein n=1 Tax=Anguilla anguilla TaxID=7936 RepID=A0A0E9P7T2_ANGAN
MFHSIHETWHLKAAWMK